MCIEEIKSCMLSDLHCSSMEACFWCMVSGWESMMGSRAGVSLRTTALLDACSLWKTGRAETELRSNKHVARMSHNFILDCSFEGSCNGAKVKAWTSAQKSMHEWQKTWLWMEKADFSCVNLTNAVFVLYSVLLKIFPKGHGSERSVVRSAELNILTRALREMCSVDQLMLNRFLSV